MDAASLVNGEVDIVVFKYEELLDESLDLSKKIEEAYGQTGYGICVVSGIPNYVELRAKLLPLASKVAELPKETLQKYEFPQYYYAVGWSHGKEKFLNQPDFSKGSFYANPQYDNIHGDKPVADGDTFAPNVWPSEVPELESAFKNLGNLVVEVGMKLAKHIDAYIEKKNPSIEKGKTYRIIKESKCCKARLLHYFPSNDSKDADSDWCGFHNDHGTLTGLASAIYFDGKGEAVDFKDPDSGLFVQMRSNEIKKASIPKDCLAFQIGESAQIHSGGAVLATPHAVLRGKKLAGTGYCRNTLAVFMQPNKDEPMVPPEGVPKESVFVREAFRVPKLQDRWDEKQTFDQFASKTVETYSKDQ